MLEQQVADSPAARQRQTTELEAKLLRAVGEFVLAFGDAEAWTHACIGLLCDEPWLREMANCEWDFERRRVFVVKLAEKRVVPKSLQQDWQHVWSRAQALALKRNLIAHGALASGGDTSKAPEPQIGVVTSFRQMFRDPTSARKVLSEIEGHIDETRNLVRDIGELSRRIAACPSRNGLVPKHSS
jgi:hypothetical protein